MAQQTAIDWLIEQLAELDKQLDGKRRSDDSTVIKINPTKIYEQAKQMEKEQIFHAFGVGCHVESTRLIGYHGMAEQYYNETFNK